MDAPYRRLLILLGINVAVMFAITYATVWEWGHAGSPGAFKRASPS
jgi:hypothetical protein